MGIPKDRNNRVLGLYWAEDVLGMVDQFAIILCGFRVKLTSDRIKTFNTCGVRCVTCGIEGTIFALEQPAGYTPHLSLYAMDDQGRYVLMTKDHIVPKSKGGASNLSNYQTMCLPCNKEKGCRMPQSPPALHAQE